MKININFEGLNKVLCQLGLHRWFVDARDSYETYRGKVVLIDKECIDCGFVKYRTKE